jgi:hypothetical protein
MNYLFLEHVKIDLKACAFLRALIFTYEEKGKEEVMNETNPSHGTLHPF